MNVLRKFSESETDYLLYQNRLDAVLTYNTWLRDLEDARQEKEQALARELQALARERLALEKERQTQKEKEQAEEKLRDLLLLLKKKGIDPTDIDRPHDSGLRP